MKASYLNGIQQASRNPKTEDRWNTPDITYTHGLQKISYQQPKCSFHVLETAFQLYNQFNKLK